MTPTAATYWRRQARRTARRHNVACVLAEFLPWALGGSAIFACGLLIARENHLASPALWLGYAIGLLAALEIALRRARGRFFTAAEGVVRLEWRLRLDNRLSAALAGVGAFPAVQAAPDGFVWNWPRIALPVVAAAALVAAAATVPLARRPAATYRPPATPVAWTQTAGWIDALQQTDTLQEPALEQLRERLAQLQKQPAEDWYSQSSLEAGDSLHGQTQQSLQDLQRDLQSALGNLEALERFSDQTSAAEMKGTHEALAHALKGLALGNLPLNAELLSSLKAADLSNLKSLSAAQLEQLKERLKSGDKACQNCLHPGEMEGRTKRLVQVTQRPGGTGGGDGSAPLTLNEKPADLGSAKLAPVSSNDLDHALPGDVMGVGQGEHPVDPAAYAGPVSAGAISSQGVGGEAVWRDDLTPSEREALKRFFK